MNSVIKCESRVAILMATYNGERFIREQLESLRLQTYEDFRCYIHDDGSSDETKAIIKKYALDYPERFTVLGGTSKGGAGSNFMYLLSIVDSKYIMFCDQDDVWLPNKIERTLKEMEETEKISGKGILVHSDMKYVDEKLKVIAESYRDYTGKNNQGHSLKELLFRNIIAGCTVMINDILRVEMLCVTSMDNIHMHDWWAALIASINGRICFIPEPLMLYRQHSANFTGNKTHINILTRLGRWIDLKTAVRNKKVFINRRIKMAQELLLHAEKYSENYIFLWQLANIDSMKKHDRLKFYVENGLIDSKKNFLWQAIWI